MLKNCENTTETQGFCWVDTHLSALVAVSEGSLSSGDGKGSDRMYPFVPPLSPLLSRPQVLGILALWQRGGRKS